MCDSFTLLGAKWADAENPDCVMHMCIQNAIQSTDDSKNCPVIKQCNDVSFHPYSCSRLVSIFNIGGPN